MNKVTRILLAIGLILAVAAPAFAEFKLNGYYRLVGYGEEKKAAGGSTDEEGDSQSFIDQRLRMRANWTLNDNVGLVYFAEVDTTWGENNKAAMGQGGMSSGFGGGADGVNVETKQAFLDLKFGDTAAQLGIVGVADAFQSIVVNDDMAGAQVTHKLGNTNLKLVYSKWDEDDADGANDSTVRGDWDDFDFYVGEVGHKFNDNFKAGLGVYFMDDNRADAVTNAGDYDQEVFFYGLNADARFGNFGIDGFVMMQDGERQYTNPVATGQMEDYDFTGYAASAKLNYKLESGDLGLRVIYFTEDDENDEDGRWQGFKGQYAFVKENQMQFLTDPYVMNDGKERYAEVDAIGGGYGLLAVIVSGNHKLPSDMYLNWGAGYYMAADDTTNAGTQGTDIELKREGDELGYEVCVRVGKKYFEKVDVSLNASYAGYGDFYDNTVAKDGVANSGDPDDTYKTYLMVNVPF